MFIVAERLSLEAKRTVQVNMETHEKKVQEMIAKLAWIMHWAVKCGSYVGKPVCTKFEN